MINILQEIFLRKCCKSIFLDIIAFFFYYGIFLTVLLLFFLLFVIPLETLISRSEDHGYTNLVEKTWINDRRHGWLR